MIEEVGDAIVARLKQRTELRAWNVEHFPDAVKRAKSASPMTLLVSYEGSTDGPLISDLPAATDRSVVWAVSIVAKGLRGRDSASWAIDAVRRGLTGWTPPQGGEPLRPLKDGFISEDEGVWRFVVQFTAMIPAVSDPTVGNDPPYAPSEDFGADVDSHIDPGLLNNLVTHE